MNIPKILITFIVIFVCVGAVMAMKAVAPKSQPKEVDLPLKAARIKGSPSATVKVLEFTDFQCPACARAALMLEEIVATYKGRVSVEHKHFPLRMHTNAPRASVFAQCAAEQGKFWPMHDVLFKSQSSWSQMTAPDPYLFQLSAAMGLDSTAMQVCVAGEAAAKAVTADQAEGNALGIKATPSFVVNGKVVVGLDNLKNELQTLLK